jgi:hypothetical protein
MQATAWAGLTRRMSAGMGPTRRAERGRVVARKPWRKGYVMDNVQRFESMPDRSREIFTLVRAREVQDDGTIVTMRHGETAIEAISRHARITGRQSTRLYREHVPTIFNAGFWDIDPPRIMLANFEARQAWQHKHGRPLASPHIETPAEFDPKAVFDETIGAMVGRSELASASGARAVVRPSSDRRRAVVEPSSDRRREANPTESFEADAKKAENPSRSRSASKEARVNLKAIGGEGRSPAGSKAAGADDPSGSDGAEVVDLKTGEVIDPDDFRDQTPEERERQHAELLPEAPPPDEAVKAAALFNDHDVEDEGAL